MPKKRAGRQPSPTQGTPTRPEHPSYELHVDLSEKQIEADVANYFGFLSGLAKQYGRFRLLDVNEQLTGADKKFVDYAAVYFLQFKKPIGLRPVVASELNDRLRSNASPRQCIRRFRQAEELEQHPYSVCFPLRQRSKGASDYQHNILRAYEKPPLSRALYICPLHLTSTDYLAAMGALTHPQDPFLFRPFMWIRDGQHVAHVARMIPFLRAHAAIVPHDTVTTSAHYYSFSSNATDVAFHSPLRVENGPSRLSDFIGREIEHISRLEPSSNAIEGIVAILRDAAAGWLHPRGARHPSPEDPFDWLHWHGQQLHEEFEIRQVLFVAMKDPA